MAESFIAVEGQAAQTALIERAVRQKASVDLWTQGGEIRTRAKVAAFHQRSNRLLFDPDPQGLPAMQLAKRAEHGKFTEFYFKVSFPTLMIFFKAIILGVDGTRIVFEKTPPLHKLQRRKHPRIPCPPLYAIAVSLDSPSGTTGLASMKATCKLCDLSVGGISVQCPSDWVKSPPQPGHFFSFLEFSLYGRSIHCKGEVRTLILPTKSDPFGRIGVQFLGLSAPDLNWIQNFIEQEGYKFFADLLRDQQDGLQS